MTKGTDFPIDAFPPSLRRFVRETADALPVPVDLVALPVLVAAGAAIGRSTMIRIKEGWTESAALYGAVVAPTGSMKTPALAKAMVPILAQQAKYERAYREAHAQYVIEKRSNAKRSGTLQDEEPAEGPTELSEPVMQRTWVADATVESLGLLLAQNPRGLIVIRDEFSAFIKSFNQYRGGRGTDRQFYLSAYSGSSIFVDRIGRKCPIFIQNPFLSVVGTIPPDVLSELAEEQTGEDGLFPRILFAYPEPIPVRWTEFAVSKQTESTYNLLFDALYSLEPEVDHETGDVGPVRLLLTQQAAKHFMTWHDVHCPATESSSLSLPLRGIYSKLKGICARLALIHAVYTEPTAREVSVQSIEAAIALVDYFKTQAVKVCHHLAQPRKTPMERCEREIRRNLFNEAVRTRRELQQGGNADAQVFNLVFEAMLREGKIIETTREGKRGGAMKAYRLAV